MNGKHSVSDRNLETDRVYVDKFCSLLPMFTFAVDNPLRSKAAEAISKGSVTIGMKDWIRCKFSSKENGKMPTATQCCANGFTVAQQDDGLPSHVHYCMSKKIAQLTKVICILNAKIDEMEMKFKDKLEQHKTEIDHLTFQHATKLARHEELLEEEIQNRAKISKLESIMEGMRAEHQGREEALQNSLLQVQKNQQEVMSAYKIQLTELREVLLKTQEDQIRGSELAEATIRNWKQHQCPDIEPFRKEIDRLRLELESTSEEKNRITEKLENARHAIAGDFQHQITRLSAEVSAKHETVRRQEQTIELLSNSLLKATEDLRRTEEEQKVTVDKLANTIRVRTESEIGDKWRTFMEEESVRCEQELTKLHQILRANEDRWQDEKTRFEDSLEQRKQEYEQVIGELNTAKTRLTQENDLLKSMLEREQNLFAEKRKHFNQTMEQYRLDKTKLETDCGVLRRKVQAMEKLVSQLKQKEKINTKPDRSELVKNLETDKSQMGNEIGELKLQLSALEITVSESKTRFQNALTGIHEHAIKIRKTYTKMLENFTHDLEKHQAECHQLRIKMGEGARKLKTYFKKHSSSSDHPESEGTQPLNNEAKTKRTSLVEVNARQEENERSKRAIKKLSMDHQAEKNELKLQVTCEKKNKKVPTVDISATNDLLLNMNNLKLLDFL